jgi:hypothetical protein
MCDTAVRLIALGKKYRIGETYPNFPSLRILMSITRGGQLGDKWREVVRPLWEWGTQLIPNEDRASTSIKGE